MRWTMKDGSFKNDKINMSVIAGRYENEYNVSPFSTENA